MGIRGTVLALILTVGLIYKGSVQAQSVQILGNNALNGAINGVVLGGATMLLADKKVNAPFNKNLEDLYAIQVGLGIGTLYGVGMGAYDVVTSSGRDLLVSGFFNDANNSSAIILMDTFYGAAAGGLIAFSVSLVSSDPIFDAMQDGVGIGAFVGFGFGVIDSFMIASRSTEPIAFNSSQNNSANGFASINFDQNVSIGLIYPSLLSTFSFNNGVLANEVNFNMEMVNLKLSF